MASSGSAQIVSVEVGSHYATTASSLAASCPWCSSSPSYTVGQLNIHCIAAMRSLEVWRNTPKLIGD